MSAFAEAYVYKEDWETDKDGIQEQKRAEALDANPGHTITSETETCPVDGVDDQSVMLVRFFDSADEEASA